MSNKLTHVHNYKGGYASGLRTLIYCRESRDDYRENYERIETQRDYLLRFCQREGLTNYIADPIMDDNVSGVCFERLRSVQGLMEKRLVDVIVFKDSARLGRNQLESLLFMEIARKNNVHIVFADEGYDPNFAPLRFWFNEQRAQDDSRKITAVMRHRMETGDLVVKAPYGYKKEKKALVVDEDAARVVRRVFDLFLEGYGTRAIATILNHEREPTPSQRKLCNTKYPVADAWNQQHILRIIQNEVYTGKMIHNQTEKLDFRDRQRVSVPRERWIVNNEHHEAIVSRETFEKVNSMRTSFAAKKTTKNLTPFSGVLKCGRCGRNLVYVNKGGIPGFYMCAKYHKEGNIKDDIRPNYGCRSHRLALSDLMALASGFCINTVSAEEFELEMERQKKQQQADSAEYRIDKARKEAERIDAILEQNYSHLLEGIIGKEVFIKKSIEYGEKKAELERALKSLSAGEIKAKGINRARLSVMINDCLDNVTIKNCFEKIIYFLSNEITDMDQLRYNLSACEYRDMQNKGGVIFILRTN